MIRKLLLGDDSESLETAVSVQALGGTGALRIGADFLKRFFPASGVWLSDPSWENHREIAQEVADHTSQRTPTQAAEEPHSRIDDAHVVGVVAPSCCRG